jgi:hypothetical protein
MFLDLRLKAAKTCGFVPQIDMRRNGLCRLRNRSKPLNTDQPIHPGSLS